jgi:hypothetical protein
MISFLPRPSSVRLATYSRVLASCDMRTKTMRWRAELACLSPPRESRWRFVLPEEAGTGATPAKAANAASLPMRSGLSPKVTNSWDATTAPTPLTSRISGA